MFWNRLLGRFLGCVSPLHLTTGAFVPAEHLYSEQPLKTFHLGRIYIISLQHIRSLLVLCRQILFRYIFWDRSFTANGFVQSKLTYCTGFSIVFFKKRTLNAALATMEFVEKDLKWELTASAEICIFCFLLWTVYWVFISSWKKH